MYIVRLTSIVCYEIMAGDNSCWQPNYVLNKQPEKLSEQ